MKIGIIGCGIAGLASAVCLQKFLPGVSYTLLEKSAEVKEVGAGIGLGNNGVQILEKLGLFPQLQAIGFPITQTQLRDRHHRLLKKIPVGKGGYCVHRAALLAMLLSCIKQESIQLNKKCVRITAGKSVQVMCEDGSTFDFDLLIGADGIHSEVRKHLLPGKKLRFSGQTCYRGIASVSLTGEYASAYFEYLGNNLRFGLADLGSGKAYWYAVEEVSRDFADKPAERKTRLLSLFSGYPELVKHIISHTPEILRNDMYDLKPSSHKWYTDTVCLIGDAAHATTPNLAQGGCQALEDAYTLVACLAKAREPREAFARYQTVRESKVHFVVNQSWRYGQMMHSRSRLIEKIMLKIVSLTPNRYYASQLNTINNLDYLSTI